MWLALRDLPGTVSKVPKVRLGPVECMVIKDRVDQLELRVNPDRKVLRDVM